MMRRGTLVSCEDSLGRIKYRAMAWCAGLTANAALAHGGAPATPAWGGWEFDPWVAIPLFVTAALYGSGLHDLRRATGRPRKLRRAAWLFGAGWVALAIALLSPVHAISRELFWMHMTQHELLMVIAAPLIILGRPAIAMAWAFPRSALQWGLTAARAAGGGAVWRWATRLPIATFVHAVALWIWHVPALFNATLTHEGIHALQHISFTGTALLFWHAVFFGRSREAGYGVAVLMLFFTAAHSGALGALLTFASKIWYAGYAAAPAGRSLTPLEDQQLGGLIMWVPAGLIYVGAGIALFAGWLRESERRLAVRTSGAPILRGGREAGSTYAGETPALPGAAPPGGTAR